MIEPLRLTTAGFDNEWEIGQKLNEIIEVVNGWQPKEVANGCDNDGNPVIYGLAGGKEPEKPVENKGYCCRCNGEITENHKCYADKPPDNLENTIYLYCNQYGYNLLQKCCRKDLADKIREWMREQIKQATCQPWENEKSAQKCGYDVCVADILKNLTGDK
jgi:hypothetical protein